MAKTCVSSRPITRRGPKPPQPKKRGIKMGYWEQNKEGNSFSQAEGEKMIWGDQPADIMGNALKEIISVFLRDRDRLPTEAEVKAGLLFSLAVALKGAESDAKALT